MTKEKPKPNQGLKMALSIFVILISCLTLFCGGYYKGSMDMHTYLRDVTIGYDKMCQEEGYGRMVVDRTLVPSGLDSTILMTCSASGEIVYEHEECTLITFGEHDSKYWCSKE